jgi:SNF2 family DNA or RNA helicase
MLDLVQTAMEKEGYQCVRIDGTKSLPERRAAIDSLNKDDRVTIMLASINGAGEG